MRREEVLRLNCRKAEFGEEEFTGGGVILEASVPRKAGAVVKEELPIDSAEVASVEIVDVAIEEFPLPFSIGYRSSKVPPSEFDSVHLH